MLSSLSKAVIFVAFDTIILIAGERESCGSTDVRMLCVVLVLLLLLLFDQNMVDAKVFVVLLCIESVSVTNDLKKAMRSSNSRLVNIKGELVEICNRFSIAKNKDYFPSCFLNKLMIFFVERKDFIANVH